MDTTITTIEKQKFAIEASDYEVSGIGEIRIRNTGGASSSEGGMGSGSDDDKSKGDLSKSGDRSGNAASTENEDDTFDPIGKNIKEKERQADKD
jgi:hypothetical protein